MRSTEIFYKSRVYIFTAWKSFSWSLGIISISHHQTNNIRKKQSKQCLPLLLSFKKTSIGAPRTNDSYVKVVAASSDALLKYIDL